MSLSFPAICPNSKKSWYHRMMLIVIIVLAAGLRFGYLIEQQANPMPLMVSESKEFDQYNYVTMAKDLMAHHWLGSMNPGHSPVYSYLIAVIYSLFGEEMNFVFIFQILYGVLAVYLIYRVSYLLFQNERLALVTAGLAALYSPFMYYECALLREAVVAYTNLVSFYFLLLAVKKGKFKNYFWSGFFVALALILRAGPLSIGVIGYLLLQKKGDWRWLKRLAVFLLGMACVITPLALRNASIGFKALTETSGPSLFWLGNSYDSPGIGLSYTKTQKILTAETEGRISKTLAVLGREIKMHPVEYRDLVYRKFKMLFNGFEIPANLSYDLFKEQSVLLKVVPFNFVLISPLALLALILLWRRYPLVTLLYLYIGILTAFVFVFHIQSRYRVAFLPFYIIAAGYALYWFYEIIRQKSFPWIWGGTGMFCALFMFTYPDQAIMGRYFDGGIRGIDYANMASAYLMRLEKKQYSGQIKVDHLQKAIYYYDKALPFMSPFDKSAILVTQGVIYGDLGFKVRALDSFAKALDFDPNNANAQKEYKRFKEKIF